MEVALFGRKCSSCLTEVFEVLGCGPRFEDKVLTRYNFSGGVSPNRDRSPTMFWNTRSVSNSILFGIYTNRQYTLITTTVDVWIFDEVAPFKLLSLSVFRVKRYKYGGPVRSSEDP